MDESTRRMLLLGRQAPPRALSLRLEPRTYLSPQNAPIGAVPYRVEKHFAEAGWSDEDAFAVASSRYEEKQQRRTTKASSLEDFQAQVKRRAAEVSKSLRMQKLDWKQQLEAKQELRSKCLAYSRKVDLRNSVNLRKKSAEAAADTTSDDDDDEDDDDAETSPKRSTFTAPASPLGSPRRSTLMRGPTPSAPSAAPRAARQGGGDSKVHVWRHAAAPGKRLGVPGAAAPLPAAASAAAEEPLAPPGHVREHIHAWREQQAIYRGALQPGVAAPRPLSGAPPLSAAARIDALGQHQPFSKADPQPASAGFSRPGAPQRGDARAVDSHGAVGSVRAGGGVREGAMEGAGWAVRERGSAGDAAARGEGADVDSWNQNAEVGPLFGRGTPSGSPLQPLRAAGLAARDRARSELLRFAADTHAQPSGWRDVELAVDVVEAADSPAIVMGDVTNTLAAQRDAGDARATTARPDGAGSSADRTAAVRAEKASGEGSAAMPGPSAVRPVPVVQASRTGPFGTAKGVAGGGMRGGALAQSARVESARWSAAMLARLRDKVAQQGIELPPLCACARVSVLDSSYPLHCCANCPLHNNPGLYYSMLGDVLHGYGLL